MEMQPQAMLQIPSRFAERVGKFHVQTNVNDTHEL